MHSTCSCAFVVVLVARDLVMGSSLQVLIALLHRTRRTLIWLRPRLLGSDGRLENISLCYVTACSVQKS